VHSICISYQNKCLRIMYILLSPRCCELCAMYMISLAVTAVCKWLGVYLCMRESPTTTPAVLDKYNVVIVAKGIHSFIRASVHATPSAVRQFLLHVDVVLEFKRSLCVF